LTRTCFPGDLTLVRADAMSAPLALTGAAQQGYKDFPGYCNKVNDDEGRTA